MTELVCDDDEDRLIRDAIISTPSTGDADGDGITDDPVVTNHGGGFCAAAGTVEAGTQIIGPEEILAKVNFPDIEVHHNPHAEFFLPNLDTWFWHEGATTLTQTDISIPLDAGGSVRGTFSGSITGYCWVVDDSRGELVTRAAADDKFCTTPDGATSLRSSKPGKDSETRAAAHHIFTTAGYATTITHEVQWSGSFTINGAPISSLVNEVLALGSTHIRAQTQVPVRQLYPYPVPNPS